MKLRSKITLRMSCMRDNIAWLFDWLLTVLSFEASCLLFYLLSWCYIWSHEEVFVTWRSVCYYHSSLMAPYYDIVMESAHISFCIFDFDVDACSKQSSIKSAQTKCGFARLALNDATWWVRNHMWRNLQNWCNSSRATCSSKKVSNFCPSRAVSTKIRRHFGLFLTLFCYILSLTFLISTLMWVVFIL